MNSQISVVGLDLDGTLYPSTAETQKRIRGKIYEKLAKYFKIPVQTATELFEQGYSRTSSGSQTIAEIATNLRRPLPKEDIVQRSLEQADILDLIQQNPELAEMLKRISKKRRLDLLTGSARKLAIQKLEKIGISQDTFNTLYTDEDGSKSNGDLYRKWTRDTKKPRDQHLYVGDNKKTDIDVPNGLGIKTAFIGAYSAATIQLAGILDLEEVLMRQKE